MSSLEITNIGQGFIHRPIDARVYFENIKFKNVNVTKNLLRAGLLRCNYTQPCINVTFEDVNVHGGLSEYGYVCDDAISVIGSSDNISSPDPSTCISNTSNY